MTIFKANDHFDISGTQIGIILKCIDDMGGNFGDCPDDVWEWGRARDVIEKVLEKPINHHVKRSILPFFKVLKNGISSKKDGEEE